MVAQSVTVPTIFFFLPCYAFPRLYLSHTPSTSAYPKNQVESSLLRTSHTSSIASLLLFCTFRLPLACFNSSLHLRLYLANPPLTGLSHILESRKSRREFHLWRRGVGCYSHKISRQTVPSTLETARCGAYHKACHKREGLFSHGCRQGRCCSILCSMDSMLPYSVLDGMLAIDREKPGKLILYQV